jgi:tetratricopeptide (TPR) repeat protein
MLGGDWYRTGVVLNLLCAATNLILIYRLLLRLFNRRLAVLATIGVSLVFEFFVQSHKASSDLLFLLLFNLTVVLLVTDRLAWRRVIGAGICSGLAYLTRYNGLVLPVGVLGWLFLVNPGRWPVRRRLGILAVYLGVFVAVVVPWYLANYIETGRPLATMHLQNIFVEEFYGGDHGDRMPGERLTTLPQIILHDPLHFLQVYLANLPRHFWWDLSHTLNRAFSVLLVIGFLRWLWYPPSRRQWAYFVFPLCYFLGMGLVYHQPRFSFPLLAAYNAIAFAVLSGDGFNQSSRWAAALTRKLDSWRERSERLRQRLGGKRAVVGLSFTVVIAGAIFASQIYDIVTVERYYYIRRPTFILTLGPQLAQLAAADQQGARPQGQTKTEPAIVMARKPHVAFYAGMRFLPYPRQLGSMAQFVSLAVERNVRYIVYSGIERDHYPGQIFLRELDQAAGIQKIYADDYSIVYELTPGMTAGQAAENEVLVHLKQELQQARENNRPWQVFVLCYRIADQYLVDWDWGSAARYLEDGLSAGERVPTLEAKREVARMKTHLALAYYNLGRYRDAVRLLEASLISIEILEDDGILATAHAGLGQNYTKLGQNSLARQHLQRARHHYLVAGDDRNAQLMQRNIRALQESE